jgi:hypothetical protein
MKTFKFKSADSDPDSMEGTVEADSPEMAIKSFKEEYEMYPGEYVLLSPDEQIPFTIPRSPREPTETRKFYSFGRKVRWVGLAIFPTPIFLMVGLFMWHWLKTEGKQQWLFPVIVIGGFIVCGIGRGLIVDKILESFVCPRCQTPEDDWQRDSDFRIYYKCRKCRIKWDIGYKFDPGGGNRYPKSP